MLRLRPSESLVLRAFVFLCYLRRTGKLIVAKRAQWMDLFPLDSSILLSSIWRSSASAACLEQMSSHSSCTSSSIPSEAALGIISSRDQSPRRKEQAQHARKNARNLRQLGLLILLSETRPGCSKDRGNLPVLAQLTPPKASTSREALHDERLATRDS